MKEIWKEIKGFDGRYSVSNYGRVRQNNYEYISLQNKKIIGKEKIIEPTIWQSRYLRIDLQINRKETKTRLNTYIHKLVAEYFLGPRPEGYEIDHIDGNYLNNKVDNLRYCTHLENMNNPISKEKHKYCSPSPETRKKISEKLKGRKDSEETRRKKSESHKNKPNLYKGRIWINNGILNKVIHKEDLQDYINKGYKLGRKIK